MSLDGCQVRTTVVVDTAHRLASPRPSLRRSSRRLTGGMVAKAAGQGVLITCVMVAVPVGGYYLGPDAWHSVEAYIDGMGTGAPLVSAAVEGAVPVPGPGGLLLFAGAVLALILLRGRRARGR